MTNPKSSEVVEVMALNSKIVAQVAETIKHEIAAQKSLPELNCEAIAWAAFSTFYAALSAAGYEIVKRDHYAELLAASRAANKEGV